MSSFTEKLELYELLPGLWETKRSFCYWHETPDKLICVPEGFETDGATIPKGFRWLLKKDGPYVQAAVLHDWIHEQEGDMEFGYISREENDLIFLEAMKVLKINPIIRNIMYLAVSALTLLHGGQYSY